MGQIWLRSDSRVEKKGGTDRQTGRQTDRQRFLQLYIVDVTKVACRVNADAAVNIFLNFKHAFLNLMQVLEETPSLTIVLIVYK